MAIDTLYSVYTVCMTDIGEFIRDSIAHTYFTRPNIFVMTRNLKQKYFIYIQLTQYESYLRP